MSKVKIENSIMETITIDETFFSTLIFDYLFCSISN